MLHRSTCGCESLRGAVDKALVVSELESYESVCFWTNMEKVWVK